MDGAGVLIWIASGLAVMQCTEGISPPSGARVVSYDLDYSVTWDPPADVSEGVNITYTVTYAEHTSVLFDDLSWVQVDACTDITVTRCNATGVVGHFRDFAAYCVLRIVAVSGGVRSEPLRVDLYPRQNVHLSAPTVHVSEVTDSYLRLDILGPPSPYRNGTDSTMTLRVEDVDPLIRKQIYFNIVLEGETEERVMNTSAQYPMAEFHDLRPGAKYTISTRSIFLWSYGTTCSPQPSVSEVATTLDDKVYRPLDVELHELPVDCNYPDMREVVVSWKRPIAYEHIPFFDLKYWNLDREHEATSFVIPREINRTKYSFRLRSLPRWTLIRVTVSANTSIAGCTSFESALFQHVVNEDSSRPENLSFSKPAPDTWTFLWRAPSSCGECVAGYEVTWESDTPGGDTTKNVSRDVVSSEELKYQIQTEQDVTLVRVTTLLSSGAFMTKRGQEAVLGIQYEESIDYFKMIIICLAGLALSLVVILISFFKVRSRRKWKDGPSILEVLSSKSSQSEKQLFRQYSSSLPAHEYSGSIYVKEPEIFDDLLPAPSDGKPSSAILLTRKAGPTAPASGGREPENSTPR